MFAFFERLIHPYPDDAVRPAPAKLLAFLWACTRGLRWPLMLLMALAAAIGAFEALLFAFMGRIVDWLATVKPADFWTVHGQTLGWLALALVASLGLTCTWALLRFNAINGNFPMRLRWNFHRQLLEQSMAFYQDEFAGRIATKLMQTALAVRDVWTIASDILVYVFVYFGTLIAVLAGFDARLLIPFLGWFALYLAMMWFFVPRLAKVAQAQADARSLMTGRVTDAYTNIATVKLFSHARREAGFARSAMHEFLDTVYRQMRYVTWVDQVNQALSVLLIGTTMGMALWLWSKGEVGVGAVAAASAMSLRLNGIAHWIMWEMATLFEHIGTVADGIGILSKQQAVVDAPDAKPIVVPKGEVRFERVGFAYGGKSQRVIDDFTLTIRPGEKIGLVGRSGAGKSTIVNLLLRFYDLQQGRILIDGQDIAHATQNSLRAAIGMVTQDTSLLHRSVRDNIVYGRPDASEADMLAAAQRAEAHTFIQGLADLKGRTGYDAHVGERGVKLSGGQRQRIAIARVMLKDAPILLLDEATSALDSEVEAAIQASLYKLMEGKTVVAIAHRLSTIAAMDRLIVMDHGRIVEQGTHRELLAAGGIYARLWEHQSGGFLGNEEDEEASEQRRVA
ncbi:MAG TPA: ABC transporter ATP-binding protein [Burkholderiaceae bacterium]|nr:ABC transporter ATP-binding protein [Burkholderiaceae bacterium]